MAFRKLHDIRYAEIADGGPTYEFSLWQKSHILRRECIRVKTVMKGYGDTAVDLFLLFLTLFTARTYSLSLLPFGSIVSIREHFIDDIHLFEAPCL